MRLPWDSRTSAWIAILSLPFSSLKVGNSQLASFLMFSGVASGSNQVPGHGASLSMMRLTLTSPTFQVLMGVRPPLPGRNLTRFHGGRQTGLANFEVDIHPGSERPVPRDASRGQAAR